MESLKRALTDERGFVLAVSLLIITLLAGAGVAAIVSMQLDLKSSGNLNTAARALYVAEAGVHHARRELQDRNVTMNFDQVVGMRPGAVIVANSKFNGGSYTVTRLGSETNPLRIKALSRGTAPNKAASEIEVWLRRDAGRPRKALITNGNLKISGNPKFLGTCGRAHSNDDMQVPGSPAVQMADGLTSSNRERGGGEIPEGMNITGTPCIGSPGCSSAPDQQPTANKLDTPEKRAAYEVGHGSAPPYEVARINPADYAPEVASLGEAGKGYVLHDDGTVTTGPGIVCGADGLCSRGNAVPIPNGWLFSGGAWTVTGASAAEGVFYSEGRVEISGNMGSAKSPWQSTVVARDSIRISGDIHLRPYPTAAPALQNLLLVTGDDLEISSNMMANSAGSAILVHQQLKITGSPELSAFIIVGAGQPSWVGDPFPKSGLGINLSEISGNPQIDFACNFGCLGPGCPPPLIVMTGWKQKF